jgi:hypothetical protein
VSRLSWDSALVSSPFRVRAPRSADSSQARDRREPPRETLRVLAAGEHLDRITEQSYGDESAKLEAALFGDADVASIAKGRSGNESPGAVEAQLPTDADGSGTGSPTIPLTPTSGVLDRLVEGLPSAV